MSGHAAHDWSSRCLATADRVLDATGNLKAVQKLLGHASIQTTGASKPTGTSTSPAATIADVLATDEDDETADSQSFPRPCRKSSRFAAETRIRWVRKGAKNLRNLALPITASRGFGAAYVVRTLDADRQLLRS